MDIGEVIYLGEVRVPHLRIDLCPLHIVHIALQQNIGCSIELVELAACSLNDLFGFRGQ